MSGLIEKLIANPCEVFNENSQNSKDALSLVKQFLDPIAASNSVLDEIYTEGLDSSQVWGQVKLVVDGVNDKLLGEQLPELKQKFGLKTDLANEHSAEEEESSEDGEEFGSDEDQLGEEGEFAESGEGIEQDDSEEEENQDELLEDQDDLFHSLDEEIEEPAEQDESDQESEPKPEKPSTKKDVFGLNDGFFDIDEFNKQVLALEVNGNDQDDDEIDYFGDLSDGEASDEEEVAYYNDFFSSGEPKPQAGKGKGKKAKKTGGSEQVYDENGQFVEEEYDRAVGSTMLDLFADEDQESEAEDAQNEENLSTFEKQQRLIQREIAKLEAELVAEKSWALKGESKAKDRPEDALLKEDLEFERTAKPVPVITKEVTESIEDLIRRRIKDQQFDELIKRTLADVSRFNKSRKYELSEEKSSKSLAELYEDDFKGESANSKTDEELERAHAEISQLFQSLTHKLDLLSSCHFIPKPAQKSLDVKVQTATISMEDAQPLTLSNASTLAPQELFSVKTGNKDKEVSLKSGLVISKDELSRDEKQRLRRLNKRKRSKEYKSRVVAVSGSEPATKKSKKSEVISTLSKAKNLTVINSKGEKRDAQGKLVKESKPVGSSNLKL